MKLKSLFIVSILSLTVINTIDAQSIMIELDESINGKKHSLTVTSLKEKKATTTTYDSVEEAKLAYLTVLDESTARLNKVEDTEQMHLTINGNEIIRHSVLVMPDIPRGGMHSPPPPPPGMQPERNASPGSNDHQGGRPAPPAPPAPRK